MYLVEGEETHLCAKASDAGKLIGMGWQRMASAVKKNNPAVCNGYRVTKVTGSVLVELKSEAQIDKGRKPQEQIQSDNFNHY